ncbi:MAG: fructose-bisphosphate aldolase, partial [Actinomycetota bacterium]|nr:fructose-bisphosphate aldolase [Actinomycetota bacterium]
AITLDHAIARGVLPGLVDVESAVESVAAGRPDAITLQKGIASRIFSPDYAADGISLIVKATSYSPFHPTLDTPTATVEEAVRLGADAISVGMLIGGANQAEQLTHLSSVAREAEALGLPLAAHIYPRGEDLKGERKSVENVQYAVRAGAEVGVDIVKTEYTGSAESFAKVVQAAYPAKVVLAGGSPGGELRDYLQMTADALAAGAAGFTYGRFVWQHHQPDRVVEALRLMVHQDKSVDDALQHVATDSQYTAAEHTSVAGREK